MDHTQRGDVNAGEKHAAKDGGVRAGVVEGRDQGWIWLKYTVQMCENLKRINEKYCMIFF